MKLFPTLCFFALVAAPLRAQDAPPVVAPETALPNPVLPNPNGYDFYVRAGKALVGGPSGTPSAATLPQTPEADLKLQRTAVAREQKALALLREGFNFESRRPPMRGLGIDFGPNASFREMARLLIQESRVRAADGNLQGAADSALDAMRLSHDIARGGPLLSLLSGIAIESIGRGELQTLLPRLNVVQLRAAIARLQDIEARRVSYADAIEEEKWEHLSRLRAVTSSDEWKRFRATKDASQIKPEDLGLDTPQQVEAALKVSDAQIETNLLALSEVSVAQARLPYGHSKPIVPPADPISELYVSFSISQMGHFVYEKARAQTALLLTQLALRAFKLEHGAYPETLGELVPASLKAAPTDPFAADAPLHYKRNGERFTLYSIGPDGKDDGGQPIETQAVVKDAETGVTSLERARMTEASTGDIVAGINF